MSLLNLVDSMPKFRGFTTLFSMKGDRITRCFYRKNMIMDGASLATAMVWGGVTGYKAGAMYFEFQNLASPGDTPAYPTVVHTEGVEYYTGLLYSPDKDIVRVPILASPNVTDTASGKLLTLYALAPDVSLGFFGKPFSGAANSVVIGGALVATPDQSVQSNDVILCRNYPAGTKVAKTVGEQIGMVWNVEFPYPIIES